MNHRAVYLIGLTGNIACGKSTVLEMLREHGASVIDADRVTRELQAPGQPVYEQIVAEFGSDILTEPSGPIDRPRLGAIVFADPAALRRLEQLVHPAVHSKLMNWLNALGTVERSSQSPIPNSQSPIVAVIDAIKLLEAGWRPLCDAIWVVTCAPEQQLARLIATRGLSEAEARVRIDAQPPQSAKVAQADVVIDNGGTLEGTRRQVETAWQAIERAAATRKHS